MDLDFSFALVSSLTPRRKAEKSCASENLKKATLLKGRLNLPVKLIKPEDISHQNREEKENILPKDQLMNKDEFIKPNGIERNFDPSNNIHRRKSNDKSCSSFSINMENIAVRRNRTRGRKKVETSPLQPCDNVLEISNESVAGNSNSPNERYSLSTPEIINTSSDIDENCHKTRLNRIKTKNTKGKSCLNRVSDVSVRSSLEVVNSSRLEVKTDIDRLVESTDSNCKGSLSTVNLNVKSHLKRISGVSETSLSTAYDSDSFQAVRRQGVIVIPETPDTDESFRETYQKKNSSILCHTGTTEVGHDSTSHASPKRSLRVKRKSSEISSSPDENKKKYSVESTCSSLRANMKSHLTSPPEKHSEVNTFDTSIVDDSNLTNKLNIISSEYQMVGQNRKDKADVRQKKKLRKSNESVSDMFKLESTIKNQTLQSEIERDFTSTTFRSITRFSNKEQLVSDSSSISKGRNKKPSDPKSLHVIKKNIEEKEPTNLKNIGKQPTFDGSKRNIGRTKNKLSSPISPKVATLVLPTEVIPKFEHINQWLKDTQEKTIGSVEGGDEVISKKDIIPIKNKYKVSLSPRIKKKKEKAKTSLEEEKRIFEELYGGNFEKRLSDDVDEVTSCQESVGFSENVLDKLYGTVWQKDTAITQSEPRKGKKNHPKNKTPLTERKKHRTSIYEVFSSSSSEDRFEEFLENVQRGKLKTKKRSSDRPGTPEFINDSDSEDNKSLVFYQNILSSAVKDEIKRKDIKSGQDAHKVNRRRLSFSSSKDGCSESGKSDNKSTRLTKKTSKEDSKSKTRKNRSKKKGNKHIEEKDDIDVFSLVTPLKIKGKKTENDISENVTNGVLPQVPKSVGKTKTPKNLTKQKDLSNSEERLKRTYLKESDFKVPKSSIKTFKTPTKTSKLEVPSSPALSFLSSLSEMTAGLPCHPDALVYKKNFKSKREELTKRLFTLYNSEVFDHQLPEDMLIQWSSRMTSTSGYCYNKRIYRDNQILRSSRIVLSTKILDRADRLRDTLIHELCHAATWIVHATSDGHGPLWKSWADKANRRFPELPVIKRCHDYAISTKFTYKCMSCGYSIGRHSKSLDTERKRCGFCYGKFQVFVTAKMSSASVTSGSDSVKTPRNPTGFALFVKENYATVKKENNVPHAQVMKLLSQKFAEVKISKNTEEPIVIE